MVDKKVSSSADTLVAPSPPTFGEANGATIDPATGRTNGPGRVGLWARIQRCFSFWYGLSLTAQFLIIATLIVCGSMAVLGQWLSSQIAAGQIRSRAESAGLYMQGFLSPHVRQLNDNPEISEDHRQQLDRMLRGTDLADRVEGVRIWRRDGTVIYSTEKSLTGRKMLTADVARAFAGKIVAQIEEQSDDEDGVSRSYPLLEIYAPIYRTESDGIVAVGEFYEDAHQFMAELAAAQQQAWAVVGLTTGAMMALLFLIVRRANTLITNQRDKLARQLATAQELAEQNRALGATADKLRIAASQASERLLNRIGADLHDGPVQLLSLLVLRLRDPSRHPGPPSAKPRTLQHSNAGDTDAEALTKQVLSELRELSSGLVLPEIGNASLEEALRLAVARHEQATGTTVQTSFEELPDRIDPSVKVCLFRAIQEGLNNAFRHGEAQQQTVTAQANGTSIVIIVSDSGPGPVLRAEKQERVNPIGIQGIRNRVEVFGGRVELRQRRPRGAELLVEIPIGSVSGSGNSVSEPAPGKATAR